MSMTQQNLWTSSQAYERYMGRWSRLVALHFVDWLGVPAGASWIDIGCGGGALTAAIVSGGWAEVVGEHRERLKELIRARLPTGPDGEILLAARAWAAKGRARS
jgi:hypothetical protein